MAGGIAAEVKSKLNIVDVVGETVSLKKAGSTYKGLCPFHGEKTPSFTVTPARESWKCFGCGLGGDVFSFVMQRDSVAFPEALRILAGKAGVEIDERTRREDVHKARLRDVLESAIAFYHAVLTTAKLGQPALDYLRGRGFTEGTIEAYQLGWAPGGWDTMSRRLIEKRAIRPEDLAEVGLTTPRTSGRGAYDRFRERIIFPIRDQNGHAVGLGGRVLAPAGAAAGQGTATEQSAGDGRDHGPKYLNSPATPVFDKSRTLYLIDRAKGAIRKSGQAVIVEGYTDALMAHQAGFDNVVASLGTALTPGQVALLTRYAKRIALAYDVDAAGEKAGTFGVQALEGLIGQLATSDAGVELDEVRVVRLPDGKDPDEVLRDAPDRWREEVRTAEPIVDYLIDYQARQFDLRTASGKARFVDAVMPTIRSVPNPVMRDAYLGKLRQASGVEERVLLEVLHKPGARSSAGDRARTGADAQRGITADAVMASPDTLRVADILRGVSAVEAELLRLLLIAPEYQVDVVDRLGPDMLPSTIARELYRAIVLARAPDDRGVRPPFVRDAVLAALDDETRALALALYAKELPDWRSLSPARVATAIENFIADLELDRLEERGIFIAAEQGEAEREGDHESMDRLLREMRLIEEQRRSLDRRRDQTRLLTRQGGGAEPSNRTQPSVVSTPQEA
ncbi:MAG TPA: DNA primase [Candidatus Limnocylindrales bacterium]